MWFTAKCACCTHSPLLWTPLCSLWIQGSPVETVSGQWPQLWAAQTIILSLSSLSPQTKVSNSRGCVIAAISVGTLPPTAHHLKSHHYSHTKMEILSIWRKKNKVTLGKLLNLRYSAESTVGMKQLLNESSENWHRQRSKTHLSCEVIPCGQVFKAEEAVPLARSTSAGVIVHNLQWENKIINCTPTGAA